jgi:hypothetical protein
MIAKWHHHDFPNADCHHAECNCDKCFRLNFTMQIIVASSGTTKVEGLLRDRVILAPNF